MEHEDKEHRDDAKSKKLDPQKVWEGLLPYNKKPRLDMNSDSEVNRWTINNIRALNFFMLPVIIVFCGIVGTEYLEANRTVGFIIGCIIGFLFCGFLAVFILLCKDITRIADSLERNNSK